MFDLNDPKGRLDFGRNIAGRRKALGMSQEDLAEACDVQRTSVSGWETGKTVPDTSSLQIVAKALKCDLPNLLGCYDESFYAAHVFTELTGLSEAAIRVLDQEKANTLPLSLSILLQVPEFKSLLFSLYSFRVYCSTPGALSKEKDPNFDGVYWPNRAYMERAAVELDLEKQFSNLLEAIKKDLAPEKRQKKAPGWNQETKKIDVQIVGAQRLEPKKIDVQIVREEEN